MSGLKRCCTTSRGGITGSGVLLVEPYGAQGRRLAPSSKPAASAVVLGVVVVEVLVVVAAAQACVQRSTAVEKEGVELTPGGVTKTNLP